MVTIDKVQGVLHNNIVTFLYYTSINQIEFKYSMILHCAAKNYTIIIFAINSSNLIIFS